MAEGDGIVYQIQVPDRGGRWDNYAPPRPSLESVRKDADRINVRYRILKITTEVIEVATGRDSSQREGTVSDQGS